MKKIIIAILLIALLGAGGYWYTTQKSIGATAVDAANATITGSGAIEAETIVIAAESGGRVVAVHADEGAEVSAGDLLVELDDSLLTAQKTELLASIATAKANLNAVKDGPRAETVAVAQAQLAQAQAQRDSAKLTAEEMVKLVENPQDLLTPIKEVQSQIKQAEGQIELAQVAAKQAAIQEEAASRNQSNHAALVVQQITQKQRQAADLGIKMAEAGLKSLKIQLAHLWEQYNNPVAMKAQANKAQSGYQIAEAGVALAQAGLAAAQAQPRTEDIAVAEAQVKQAESALALLDVQIDRLKVFAPRNGMITTRTINPGETASAGAALLKLADLNTVTLRVFIPETQIGRAKLGQTARVTVDSTDRVFEGVVTHIANEAEYTPKNVQTQEERVNLVFAVEITLDNPDHILKPGMPADAEIMP